MQRKFSEVFGPSWQAISIFSKKYPVRFTVVSLIMLVSGVLEGVSFISFVPILDVLNHSNIEDGSRITKEILGVLSDLGLPVGVVTVLCILVGLMTIRSLLIAFGSIFVQWTFADYVASIRIGLVQSALDANWSAVRDSKTGEVVNAVLTEVESASATAQQMTQAIVSLIQIAVYLLTAIAISWQFTSASMFGALVMMFLLSFLISKSRTESEKKTATTKHYASLVADWMQNQKALKVMAIGGSAISYIVSSTERLAKSVKTLSIYQSSLVLGQEILILLFLASSIAIAHVYLKITVSELLVGIVLLQRLMAKFGALQISVNAIARQQAGFLSVRERLEGLQKAAEVEDGINSRSVDFSERLEFKNVCFNYGDSVVLAGIDLNIQCGEMVALVGPSGAGKSTLLDIVTGLIKPCAGGVLIDGVELDNVRLKEWRSQIGYVPQDVVLMHDTVRNNLQLGLGQSSDMLLKEALRMSGALDFVEQRPEGLDLIVGERGQTLSGGQRQRLALARALVRKPKLLILDEATSALDPNTELEIAKTLRNLTPEVTILMTSHRPALSEIADRVIRMDQGKVINIGTTR